MIVFGHIKINKMKKILIFIAIIFGGSVIAQTTLTLPQINAIWSAGQVPRGASNTNTWYTLFNAAAHYDTLTASRIAGVSAGKNIISLNTATYPSLTELSYVKGVTSAIQTQINSKGVGSVTSVATGYGLSGGTITGSGTLIADTAVNKLATQYYVGTHAGTQANNVTFFGIDAGLSNSNVNRETSYFGYQAGKANTDGTDNCGFGFLSQTGNVHGDHSSSFGANSMVSATNASLCTAIGYGSQYLNVDGGWNVGTGYASLYLNQHGNYNTAQLDQKILQLEQMRVTIIQVVLIIPLSVLVQLLGQGI